jgi:hypothetical protein
VVQHALQDMLPVGRDLKVSSHPERIFWWRGMARRGRPT